MLLVYPSALCNTNDRKKLASFIRSKLAARKIAVSDVVFEQDCVAFWTADPVESASIAAGLFGIERAAVARAVRKDFASLSSAIVDVAKKSILRGEKFCVRVDIADTTIDYAGRDVEFFTSGKLTSELSSAGSRPAKRADQADRLVRSYVGWRSAYVWISSSQGRGGLPYGSLGQAIFCGVDGPLSALSCYLAVKSGFVPQFFIFYDGEQNLRQNVKIFVRILEAIDTAEGKVRLARLSLPKDVNNKIVPLLAEHARCMILTSLSTERVALPLSAAIHPAWFIESIIKQVVAEGKVPWLPLLFLSDLNSVGGFDAKKDLILSQESNLNLRDISKKSYTSTNYEKKLASIVKQSIESIRLISLSKIGPNYLHDIIDSI